jgi:hypothetical protein
MPDTNLPFDVEVSPRSCWLNSAKCNIAHDVALIVYCANSLRFVERSRQKCNRTIILMHFSRASSRRLALPR